MSTSTKQAVSELGNSKFSLTCQPGTEVSIEFDNGVIKTFENLVKHIHILSPFHFNDQMEFDNIKLYYFCKMSPKIQPGRSASDFPNNLNDALFHQTICQLEESVKEKMRRSTRPPVLWKKHFVIVKFNQLQYECELVFQPEMPDNTT